MNPVVERALRALAEAGIGGPPPTVAAEEGGTAKVGKEEERSLPEGPRPGESLTEHSRTAEPCLPDAVLTARYPLAILCRATLDANPAASTLSADERRWIAEHVERAVLNWLAHVLKPEPAWDAVCPKGHGIDDGIFARVLVGWACPECEQVFPASECKLVLRSW